MLEKKQYKKAVKQLCAVALCVFICFMCSADVFALLGMTFAIPWLGIVLTGIFESRGSNYLADIIKRIQGIMSGTSTTINKYLSDSTQNMEVVKIVNT